MNIRLSYLLGCEVHNLLNAQFAYAPRDPVSEAAVRALREIYRGQAWYFETESRQVADRLRGHLEWLAYTADSIPHQTIAAARRALIRVQHAMEEL